MRRITFTKSAMKARLRKWNGRKVCGRLRQPRAASSCKLIFRRRLTTRLSEGQRIMVRAGLANLLKLEKEFATIDPTKHPKMLVVCEDTSVTPLVADFLISQGLNADEVLRVDSNRKGELPEAEWKVLREQLFDMDEH